ncbi:MAG TPA: SDR family NAD(P)-dependent oxidoreductase [Jatrophihabitans sp.]|nr:SDR family NAD(P)-dependent oxidoreductase [Jatrophihabitans sp.]
MAQEVPARRSIAELVDLSGQVALVTGAGMGIGAGIAARLADAGATVLVADLDAAAARSTADELVARGGHAEPMQVDVSDEPQVVAAIDAAVTGYGGLHILVNNAGIYPAMPIAQLTVELFDHVLAVNLRGVFLATKHAAEQMKKQQAGGRIVNVTSIDALHPSMVGLAHYDASKHGAWGFTESAALEYAPWGIRVNAIAPGGISTPGTTRPATKGQDLSAGVAAFESRIPLRRMGLPDEIGTAALFLASELSSYVTGAQLVVDGGFLLT